MRRSLACFTLLVAASLLLAACGAAAPGPMTWLDRPLDGASLPLAPVTIQAHASDDDGVASFEFFVDDDPLVTASADGGRLGMATVEWGPTKPGTYTIRARGVDAQGNVGSEAVSVVTVGQVPEIAPTAPPEPGEGEIIFFVEPEAIPLGGCAMLHWEVLPPAEALLNGEGVPPAGEREVCPEETRGYELLVPEREQERIVTLHVESPRETEVGILFAVDPDAIRVGACASLFWEVQAPEEWPVLVQGQEVPHAGEQQVCPQTTTTYELLMETPDGPQARTATLHVEAESEPPPPPGPTPTQPPGCPGPPVISSFTASPGTITAGQSTTLSWGPVTNGNTSQLVGSVVVNPGLGEVGSLGSRVVSPGSTTTYTLVATGCGGTAQQQVTVSVNPAAFSADLAITDLYPETPHGPIWVRITNRGGRSTVNHTVQLSCQWNERDPIEGTSSPGQQGPMSIPISNLGPNETQTFDTDIPVVAGYQYDMTCTIQVPFTDPNPSNNTYFEQIP